MAESRELKLLLTINDKMSSALKRAGANTKNLEKSTTKLNNAVKGLVGAYIGVQGLKMGLDSTIGAAVRWEDAFTGVRKTVDATEAQFETINNEIRTMAMRIPVAATELARIGEVAGQLGVDADHISSFTETVAKLGVTTTLTTEEAATNLARIANIMQVPLDQVGNMGSALVELGNNYATTERDINDFALRIAGAGQIAGLATSDIFAIGAAMSSVGVQAEAGGTAVQKVLIAMNTSVVTADDKLSTFAETAGLSSAEFKRAWETDAAGAFASFVTGLGDQGDKAIVTLGELGLQDQRLIRSFLSLANAGDLLTEAIASSNTAFEENVALNAEAEKRFATTASQIQLMKNNFSELGIELGTLLLPKLNDGIEMLIGWTQGWLNAGDNIKEALGSLKDFRDTLGFMLGRDSFEEEAGKALTAFRAKEIIGGEPIADQSSMMSSIPNQSNMTSAGGGSTFNFKFMGDVVDRGVLIQDIKQVLDRDSSLVGAGI